MQQLNTTSVPDFSSLTGATASEFDVALHLAVRDSITSMNDLHKAVENCVVCLRESNVGPVQMVLTMKALVRESIKRYRPFGDEDPRSNVDIMIDFVVKWSIIEYYRNAS